MSAFGAYGVTSQGITQASNIDRLQEQIAIRGFGLVESVLRPAEVAELNQKLDDVYGRQCKEVGGEDVLFSIKDADIVRCPLAYDDAFLALAHNPVMIEVAKRILGENVVLLMQNGVVNRPDRIQFQTNWHRDLNYQHWVCTKPLAVGALVCLEDFSVETGGTVFLPASHKFADFPSQDVIEMIEVTPVAAAGSIIVFDAMTFHRAGVNRSLRIRRAVNHVMGVPILAQQVDIPALLNRTPPSDPWSAAYLGYRWSATANISDWRRRKFDQVNAKPVTAR